MKITKGSASAKKPVSAARVDSSDKAKRYIRCAIDALGKSAANGDQSAKSAIADLSVVLFSMK